MIYVMFGLVLFFGIISYVLIIENSKLRYYNIANTKTKTDTVITSNIEQMLKELLQYVTTIEEINYLICKDVEVVPNILLNQDKEIQEKVPGKKVRTAKAQELYNTLTANTKRHNSLYLGLLNEENEIELVCLQLKGANLSGNNKLNGQA